jgi:hypothetical protein
MAQYIGITTLARSTRVRVPAIGVVPGDTTVVPNTPPTTEKLGWAQLQPGVVTIVDVDDPETRAALGNHNSIGQFEVAALNNSAHVYDANGNIVLQGLTANS